MKTFLKIFFFLIFTSFLLVSQAEASRRKGDWISIKKNVVCKVEEISSSLDTSEIREKLKKLKGVSKVKVSVKKGQISAQLDLTKITENKFVEKIEELGYEAELVR